MAKHTTWADTQWGDPAVPRKLTRKEAAEQWSREREDYRIGKTTLAIGGATMNEEALLAEGIRVMFSRDHCGDVRGIEAGIEAIEKLAADLPIDLAEIEGLLGESWDEGMSRCKDRKERDKGLARIGRWGVNDRLLMEAANTAKRDFYFSKFPFPRHTSRGGLIVRGVCRSAGSEFTLTDHGGTGEPQVLRLSPAYLSLRREIDVHRYGHATLIVGWADIPGEPGAVYVLRTGVGFSKRLVIAADARNRLGKSPRMRIIRNVPFVKETV